MEKKMMGLKENLDVIKHFRAPIELLVNEKTLRILSLVDSEVFTNSEARKFFAIKRKSIWLILAGLAENGLVEKRGHVYRITPTTFNLANVLAVSLRGLMTGRPVQNTNLSGLLSKIGPQFIEWAYAKGKIDREELAQYERELKESVKVMTELER